MRIAFTGHRNRLAPLGALDRIPRGLWVHGGAIGFDSQVEEYAKEHGIETRVIRPDYGKYGRKAPLIRNCEIVEAADMLVACYDGRLYGGTYFTIGLAKRFGIPVMVI